MAGGAEAGSQPDLAPVGDDECLLRLVWNSDVVDGEVQVTALPSSDLERPDRGLSVDRHPMAKRSVVTALAVYQRRKPENTIAFISEISTGAVRGLVDPDTAEKHCIVEASPQPARPDLGLLANDAHAHIASRVKLGRGAIKKLQVLLLPLFGRATPLEGYQFVNE